ncbi:hypothetical protein [Phreatobacter stygius]|uniref:Uncharacterized protein n=1 Tax=Phreatobacter stygius TaxID=1940610 RepID=A0A4D7B1M7_9HYPH|nr:hypothetical protein [Phreatobacter stygius]QCI63940.1 hypothetical protein E8M01_06575 [Phreatobacter stygius]
MAAFLALLFERDLSALHLHNAVLIGGHNRSRVGFDQSIDQRSDVLVHFRDFALVGLSKVGGLSKTLIPCVLEHRPRQIEQSLAWREPFEQSRKFTFDDCALHRLPIAQAPFAKTHVIGVLIAAPAGGPAGGHQGVAAGAGHHAAQREILSDIDARWSFRPFRQPMLNPLMGAEIN